MATPAQEGIVERVMHDRRRQLALCAFALLEQDLARGGRGDIIKLGHLDAMAQVDRHEGPDRLSQLDRRAVIPLGVNIAEIIRLAEIEFAAEREAPVEEIRFRERQDDVFPARSILDTRPEFLAGPGEVRPVHDIEISLGHLDEAHQFIDGAKAGPEVQGAGSFLLHLNREILAAGHAGVYRISFDLGEVTEIIQPLLRRLDADTVENVTGRDQHFAADHLILRAGVADDVNPLNKGRPAFLDLVMHVDSPLARGNPLRLNLQIDVTAAAVGISQLLRILANLLGRVNAALLHLEERANFLLRGHLFPGDGDLADVILRPLFEHHYDS